MAINTPDRPGANPAERIQVNLLAASERRLLNWLCVRLPGWATPDMMTALGFFGAMLCALGYLLSNFGAHWLWLSAVSYFINWFGDSLDGSLARHRKIERPNYGYFLDHSVDSLATTILVASIGLTPYVRFDVAILALVGYLLLSIHTFLSARVVGEFKLTYLAGGPTEMRLILIAITLLMYWLGPMQSRWTGWSVFDVFTAFAAMILISVYIWQTATLAARLRKLGK